MSGAYDDDTAGAAAANIADPPSPRDELPGDVVVLMPVFNDWTSCADVLTQLDAVLHEEGIAVRVTIVDDGSTEPAPREFGQGDFDAIAAVELVRLRRNVGHQRAICIGLSYIESEQDCRAVIVMDADGEDDPRDLPRLLDCFREQGESRVVFAERSKRSENALFRVFYYVYLLLHRMLVGFGVRVGNYSVIPRARLRSLVVTPELWSHYAAAVFASRQPYCTVPTRRAKRIDGSSTMNFAALVNHGLTAISVFSPVVGARLILGASALAAISIVAMLTAVSLRMFTTLAIPGWTTYTVGILFIILLQALLSVVIFSFIILANRNTAVLIPTRDFRYFIDSCSIRWSRVVQTGVRSRKAAGPIENLPE